MPGAKDAKDEKKNKRCKIFLCTILLLAIIGGIIAAVLASNGDGGDTPPGPGPGPGPNPDKPLIGYNPYIVDNSTVKAEFGQYSGILTIPENNETKLTHQEQFDNLKYNNYTIETDPRMISTGLNNR